MLTPKQLQLLPDDIVYMYIQLEDEIIADISRRIAKTGHVTDTADWQIKTLKEMGLTEKEITKNVQKTLKKSQKELDKLFDDAVFTSMRQDAEIYEKAGITTSHMFKSAATLQYIDEMRRKTSVEMENITKTLGFVDRTANKNLPKDITKMYLDTMNYTQIKVASGAFTPQQAIDQAVKKLADSGVRRIDYSTGYSNHLDVATRRAVLTGVKQTTMYIGEKWADELGCDLMEITAHARARPSHATWQGHIVSRSGKAGYLTLDDIGYGDVGGFHGANCRHDWNPYFEGMPRNHTSEELANIDPPPFDYDGKTYTAYEASQRQRDMETRMRDTKRAMIAYDSAGSDEMFTQQSIKLRNQLREYKDFSKKASLRAKTERARVYGFDRRLARKR